MTDNGSSLLTSWIPTGPIVARSFESAGTLPLKFNLYRFVAEPLLVTVHPRTHPQLLQQRPPLVLAVVRAHAHSREQTSPVPPISTFRSIQLLVPKVEKVEKVVVVGYPTLPRHTERVHRVLYFRFFLLPRPLHSYLDNSLSTPSCFSSSSSSFLSAPVRTKKRKGQERTPTHTNTHGRILVYFRK